MSLFLSDILAYLKEAYTGDGIIYRHAVPCEGENSVLDEQNTPKPLWLLLDERQRRGTGIPVDLGLSVLWSSRNVGAPSGEQPGLYVGWGDSTGSQTSTNPNNYPSNDPPKNIGGTEYDIASERWEESWRLPTRDEIEELIEECQWYPTAINGVPGYQIVGITGNSIFLPAAGSRFGSEYEDAYCFGRYWTSELNTKDARRAYLPEFGQHGPEIIAMARHIGMCIRPVLEK